MKPKKWIRISKEESDKLFRKKEDLKAMLKKKKGKVSIEEIKKLRDEIYEKYQDSEKQKEKESQIKKEID